MGWPGANPAISNTGLDNAPFQVKQIQPQTDSILDIAKRSRRQNCAFLEKNLGKRAKFCIESVKY